LKKVMGHLGEFCGPKCRGGAAEEKEVDEDNEIDQSQKRLEIEPEGSWKSGNWVPNPAVVGGGFMPG
jgi:hypothetical protein